MASQTERQRVIREASRKVANGPAWIRRPNTELAAYAKKRGYEYRTLFNWRKRGLIQDQLDDHEKRLIDLLVEMRRGGCSIEVLERLVSFVRAHGLKQQKISIILGGSTILEVFPESAGPLP